MIPEPESFSGSFFMLVRQLVAPGLIRVCHSTAHRLGGKMLEAKARLRRPLSLGFGV